VTENRYGDSLTDTLPLINVILHIKNEYARVRHARIYGSYSTMIWLILHTERVLPLIIYGTVKRKELQWEGVGKRKKLLFVQERRKLQHYRRDHESLLVFWRQSLLLGGSSHHLSYIKAKHIVYHTMLVVSPPRPRMLKLNGKDRIKLYVILGYKATQNLKLRPQLYPPGEW